MDGVIFARLGLLAEREGPWIQKSTTPNMRLPTLFPCRSRTIADRCDLLGLALTRVLIW